MALIVIATNDSALIVQELYCICNSMVLQHCLGTVLISEHERLELVLGRAEASFRIKLFQGRIARDYCCRRENRIENVGHNPN